MTQSAALRKEMPVPTMEELTLQLSMARGTDEILAVVRKHVRPMIGADGVTFVFRDNGMCHYADEDAISPLWKGQRFPMQTCISGWAMINRQVVIIEDIYLDDRIPHDAYRPTFVNSLMMVPVQQEDPVAAIGCYWARKRRPTDDEIALMQRIANVAAVAMINVALFSSLVAAKEEAVRAREAIILAMASLAETRDNDTGNHLKRTQHYVRVLAQASRDRGLFRDTLDATMIDLLFKAAPLHDIGKVGIPDRILLKPSKLNDAEYEVMKGHAELGRSAIANAERHLGTYTPFFQVAQEIAHTHHERWDGSGYPRGLKGEDIPLSGRLMAIADVYDALVSERVYKQAMSHSEAVRAIVADRGTHFDPRLIDVFVEVAPLFEGIFDNFNDDEPARLN